MHKTKTLLALALGALSLWVTNDARRRQVGELERFQGAERSELRVPAIDTGLRRPVAGDSGDGVDLESQDAWLLVMEQDPFPWKGQLPPALFKVRRTRPLPWWELESLLPRQSVFPGLPRRSRAPRSLLTLKQAWRIHDELLAGREDAPARPRSHVEAWIELNVQEGPVYLLRSGTVETRVSARTGRVLTPRKDGGKGGGIWQRLDCPRSPPPAPCLVAISHHEPIGGWSYSTLDSASKVTTWWGRDPMTGTPRKLLRVEWPASSHGGCFPSSWVESRYLAADRGPLFCGHVALRPSYGDVVGYVSPEQWRVHLDGSCELWRTGKPRKLRAGSRFSPGRSPFEPW